MSIQFPVKHIDGNLVFNHDKQVWAYYRIDGFGYDYLEHDEKLLPFQRQLAFLSNIGADIHLLLVPNPTDISNIIDKTIEDIQRKEYILRENGITFFGHVKNALLDQKELNETAEYHYYIGVQLNKHQNKYKTANVGINFIETAKEFLRGFTSPVYTAVGLLPNDILDSEINAYRSQAKQIEVALTSAYTSRIQSISAIEAAYVIEKNYSTRNNSSDVRIRKQFDVGKRVFGEDKSNVEYSAIRTKESDFYDLQNANITEASPKHLLLTRVTEDDEFEELFTQYFVIHKMEDRYVHPSSEWLYYLQLRLNFPVMVSIRAEHQENELIRKRLSNAKLEFRDQQAEASKGGQDADLSVIASHQGTIQMEKYFKEHGLPSYSTSFVFKITADNEEQLRLRSDALRDELTKSGIKIVAPYGEQVKLMLECVLGSKKYGEDYRMELSPSVLSGLMFGATTNIGDNRGFYIGSTSNFGKPVFIQPDLAAKAFDGLGNVVDSISVLVAGMTGKGKSFFMNLFVYLSTLSGSTGIIIDPKGDRKNWVDGLPFIPKENINVWTLGADKEDAGALDPFRTAFNLDDGKYIAKEILSYLTNLNLEDDGYSMLNEAVEYVGDNDEPCIVSVIKHLELMLNEADVRKYSESRYDKLQSLISQLNAMRTDPLAMLLFGEPYQNYRTLSQKAPIQVLMIQNLDLPRTEQEIEKPRAKQKISSAIMISITTWTKRYMMDSDRNSHKFILQDEASAIERSPVGAELMDFIIRMGRYYNTTLIKGSQNATDHTSDVANIGMKFTFALRGSNEAKLMAEMLNLPVTQETISTIQNLDRGQCMFQDIYGRTAVIYINPVFRDLLDAFDSSTSTKEEREREKANGDF